MSKICGIYKITSPSGKVYIGQSVDIKRRFTSYKTLNKSKSQVKLYNSFVKYGVDKHIFEIIEECLVDFLNEKERYWQEYYNVLEPSKGLNLCLTGTKDKKHLHSEETKLKMRESRKGYNHTKETIAKLSEMITCISPDGIHYSGNCKEIANIIGVTSSAIYNVLYKSITGKVKGYHSFKMLTPNDKYLANLEIIKQNKPKISDLCKQVSSANCKRLFSKPIIQYDKLMNIISEYESLSEAARQTKINAQNISSVCLGKNKSAGGYIWKYKQ